MKNANTAEPASQVSPGKDTPKITEARGDLKAEKLTGRERSYGMYQGTKRGRVFFT